MKIRLCIILAALCAARASANLQVSTINEPFGSYGNVAANVFRGVSFTTGNSADLLESISVELAQNGSSGSGSLSANLYLGDGFGRPVGTSLATFNPSNFASSPWVLSDVLFTPVVPVNLLQLQDYVFVLSADPSVTKIWALGLTETSNGFETSTAGGWSFYPGSAVRSDDSFGGAWFTDSFFRIQASVHAVETPVPESSASLSLTSIGLTLLATIGFLRRKLKFGKTA